LDAVRALELTLEDGTAAECFSAMVSSLGGPYDLIENADKHLPAAPIKLSVKAEDSGIVTGIDTRGLGLVVVALGGGRVRPDDKIDHAVGLSNLVRIGQDVVPGTEVAVVHARTTSDADEAQRAVLNSLIVGSTKPTSSALIGEIRRGDI
jgi:thymidine phosphorylase